MPVPLLHIIAPELTLTIVACVLILMGAATKPSTRRLVPWMAFLTLAGLFFYLLRQPSPEFSLHDASDSVRIGGLGQFIKILAAGVGAILVLVSWPTNPSVTGNRALHFGDDCGEYFGLMLLSLAGLMLVASANDLILLFLAIELASLPTYVMVSISRPIPLAQEAGVKYFFLGAMAAAILLFGLSYLYGTTGSTNLHTIATLFRSQSVNNAAPVLTAWQTLSIVLIISGLAFKLAAVPFHSYVADVYHGAATPVTAFLSFTPKTSGMVALLKILFVASGGLWLVPHPIFNLVWWMAVLTMTFGNVLGLVQKNIKRTLAYSSVAHTGYMLVGVTALLAGARPDSNTSAALQSVLFYLATYGLMNIAPFAVLTLLPPRTEQPGTSAETDDDLAGLGRRHLAAGLAMSVACLGLIGMPLTAGFYGKLLLIQPALSAGLYSLVLITLINAAISAGYYLQIIATLFVRTDPTHNPAFVHTHPHDSHLHPLESTSLIDAPEPARLPVVFAIAFSAFATLLIGTIFPATQTLNTAATNASILDDPIPPALTPPAASAE